ncbi:CMRF35-like molecule 1 isoform X2 [Hippopotamus amphibius kiboko]|uniref:CMRF35-like molecule 1 isoform X2 n=1 Tax=Hippopotamus amphibius kiboko TaxID=575201 RepID=UPI0025994DAA|nr:CMRF35-like molecule 1 isoform X2 [Hippopotamus amphibius kiboko]
MHLLLPFLLLVRPAGSFAITGPREERGVVGNSLTVQCRYNRGWETYVKWWCRGAAWSSCKILVETTGSEKEVKKDRVSIRDTWKNRSFTVTMKELSLSDADTYWCGIERVGTDLGTQVKVTVDPAPTTVPTTTPTTSTIHTSTAPVKSEETSGCSDVTSSCSNSSVFLRLKVLLPLIFAVLLLLLMVASLVVWSKVKRQKKAAEKSPEQVLQPLESDICYANLSLQQIENSSGSSRKKASAKSSSSAQAPFPTEDIAYAALSLATSNQEPTYSNMGHLVTHLPSRSQEEPTEYSTIKTT